MNILVTGANGQLGQSVQRLSVGTSDHYILTDVCEGYEQLDITNPDAILNLVERESIDVIVNCAAWTNVDGAESAGAIVGLLNSDAPGYLAQAMHKTGGLLIHISTDYVFGADPYNTPCTEDRTGTPTGVYGATKLQGEKNIVVSGCSHVIIRTAWLYSEYGKNFVKTMLRLTEEKESLKVVFDQVGTPTYALDLATAILAVIDDYRIHRGSSGIYDKTGVYHFSNEGVCSWYDFTKAIASMSGHNACDIQPCHSNEFPSPVVRPSYSVLDKTKIKDTFNIKIPYWTDSLRKCIDSLTSVD